MIRTYVMRLAWLKSTALFWYW